MVLAVRGEAPHPYSREVFETAFGEWFDVGTPQSVGDSGRLLYRLCRTTK